MNANALVYSEHEFGQVDGKVGELPVDGDYFDLPSGGGWNVAGKPTQKELGEYIHQKVEDEGSYARNYSNQSSDDY
jgi:hypothetical protein